MHHSDAELLDFDKSVLADWDEEQAHTALHGEARALYRNHLHIAMHLDQWAERVSQQDVDDTNAPRMDGFKQALEEIAAHLRQTHYLPGGPLLGPV
ncbi:hypothetical protein [Streptomyces sp. DH10]|uniref:hypothetical protein n=1 Tax=Streptomyces sp. DH10 TaxID=3040121 RepID=UPI002440F7CD|nr:hypothetical protein [Streptomyces sp. DH10]MDG9709537.1 hypothetical protein [Streptomyces sp. DH10]